MPLNILIVDDSQFFQRILTEIISEHHQLSVVGVASNGQEAVDKVKQLNPDVVTMDYEMPMLDGVSAVRVIMAENPLPILMLSSMTYQGAKITIDALAAGAADFMTKNFAEILGKGTNIKKQLWDTILVLGKSALLKAKQSSIQDVDKKVPDIKKEYAPKKTTIEKNIAPKIVAIGASTGGPAALAKLLKNIPGNFPFPIIINSTYA